MSRRATGFLDVQIIGDDKGVQRLLNRLETGFSPLAMAGFLGATVGPYLQERAKARFRNEGDDVSGKWQPLKDATAEIRKNGPWNVGPYHPINVRTHDMENYVTGSAGDAIMAGPVAQLTYPDPKRNVGTLLPEKMRVAQRGNPANPKTPARPVIGLNVNDLTFVLNELAFYAGKIGKGLPV